MARVLRYTADGLQEVELEPGEENGTGSANGTAAATASGSEKRRYLDRFGDPAAVVVHEVEVIVQGQPEKFFIKEHASGALARIDAKRYRVGRDGQIHRDPEAEAINGMKWELYASVMDNRGTAEAPDWQPLFTLEELDRHLRGNNPAANDFLNLLLGEVWRINPALNPLKKMQAEKMLGEL